jgi:hypothetical protein
VTRGDTLARPHSRLAALSGQKRRLAGVNSQSMFACIGSKVSLGMARRNDHLAFDGISAAGVQAAAPIFGCHVSNRPCAGEYDPTFSKFGFDRLWPIAPYRDRRLLNYCGHLGNLAGRPWPVLHQALTHARP